MSNKKENEINLAIEKIINISEGNNNQIPDNRYIIKNIIDVKVLSKYFKLKGYDSWIDYFREKGFYKKGDFKLKSSTYVSPKKLNLNIVYELFDIFKLKNNKVAQVEDCCFNNNLPSWEVVSKVIDEGDSTLHEFFNNIGRKDKPRANSKHYDRYLKVYKEECDKKGRGLYTQEVIEHKLLPNTNWLVNNCPNKEVKTYNDFIIFYGYRPPINIPKDMAIKIILDMQSKLDRPITADDFNNPKKGEIGIRTIWSIWGEVHIMQEELGLQITGKYANEKTIEELKNDLIKVCDIIYKNENRKIITYKDIENFDFTSSPSTYRRRLKEEENISLRDYIDFIGFKLQGEGNGLNYTYEDGEKIKSHYELDFSNYLRNILGLKYNKDYFRDVKYKDFDNIYKGNMNCDYKINYKGETLYIEIAGMLRYCTYLDYKNKEINSKSKIKYRNKLMKKESMFKNNNLKYNIIFPCDCNIEYFKLLFLN